MIQIVEKLIPIGHPNRPQRENKPVAVIIHYTGNSAPTATALANVNYASRKYIRKNVIVNGKTVLKTFEADGVTPFRNGSGHYYIDENSAYQVMPLNEYVAGAGDARLPEDNGYDGQTKIAYEVFNHRQNYMSIQYEICNNGNWTKACENAIEIIARDMIQYKIPATMIFRHHDLTGKTCPAPFVNNPQAWEDFKIKLQKKINELMGDDNMFNDTQGHYAEKYIEACVKAGLLTGDSNNNFHPDDNLTRAQLAVVLCRALKLPVEK